MPEAPPLHNRPPGRARAPDAPEAAATSGSATPRRLDLGMVLGVWHHLAARYDSHLFDKARSPLMHAIAWVLAALRILPQREFLDGFTTTLGRRIYAPFDVAAPADGHECWRRLVLCVHEHQHIVQWNRGPVRFAVSYLLSRRARARFEAEAYGSGLELCAWAGLPMPDVRNMARRLRSYGCGPADVALAEQLLAVTAGRAGAGEVCCEAARAAIAWLNHPDLAARHGAIEGG